MINTTSKQQAKDKLLREQCQEL